MIWVVRALRGGAGPRWQGRVRGPPWTTCAPPPIIAAALERPPSYIVQYFQYALSIKALKDGQARASMRAVLSLRLTSFGFVQMEFPRLAVNGQSYTRNASVVIA